jgi:hypothetical protein
MIQKGWIGWVGVIFLLTSCGGGGGNGGGNGGPSLPSPPASVTTTITMAGNILIEWADVPEATAYTLYMNSVGGVTKQTWDIDPLCPACAMLHTEVDVPTFVDRFFDHSGLLLDQTYYFVVTARNEVGEGAESCEASARIADNTAVPCVN